MSAVSLPAELSGRLFAHGGRGVRRVSIEVLGEQVTFTLRDGGVQVLCTCGVELCEHYTIAVGMFGEAVSAPAVRTSATPPGCRFVSEVKRGANASAGGSSMRFKW